MSDNPLESVRGLELLREERMYRNLVQPLLAFDVAHKLNEATNTIQTQRAEVKRLEDLILLVGDADSHSEEEARVFYHLLPEAKAIRARRKA